MASENKTRPTEADVAAFIEAVEHERRRTDARTVDALMRRVTGETPRMWGPSIIGYGDTHYVYESGREGDWFLVGFSPRKAKLVLYVGAGAEEYAPLLARLGTHTIGKGCLYINKLDDVDPAVLEELVVRSVARARASQG